MGLVYPSRALTKEGYKMEHQTITNIRVGSLLAGNNPRTYFDPVEMAELEASILAAKGVIQPILIRPVEGGYTLHQTWMKHAELWCLAVWCSGRHLEPV